jgi:hypothetical protein
VITRTSQGGEMALDAMGSAAGKIYQSMSSSSVNSPYFKENGNYMNDKLKGNSK